MLAGGPVDRTLTARRLLAELDRRYAALHNGDGGQADVRRDWRTRSDLPGRRVSLTCSGRRLTGRVIDLTEDGGLLFHPDAGPPTVLRPETVSDVRAASSG
jgi:biotin-(acetyl-CoA carboxylase) ligase